MKRNMILSFIFGAGIVFFMMTGSARATALTPDGTWVGFCHGVSGTEVFAPGTCNDTTFLAPPPYTWTSASDTILDVTDLFLHGDSFDVYEGGILILSTPSVTADGAGTCFAGGGWDSDPNCAFADPLYSHGSVVLGAGFHSVTIYVRESLIGGEAALRLRAVPEPATILLLGSGLIGLGFFRRKTEIV